MKISSYLKISGSIFLIIAILHLLRVIYSWPAQIGSFIVPIWLSIIAVLLAGFLAYQAFNLSK